MQDSESAAENSDDEYLEPDRKKKKIFPWSANTLTLLDRSMVSNSAAAAILTASGIELGLNSNEISSSLSTVRRYRQTVMFVGLL